MLFALHFIDDHGHVVRRVELKCTSDEDALSRVMGMRGAQTMELWRRGKRLWRIAPRAFHPSPAS